KNLASAYQNRIRGNPAKNLEKATAASEALTVFKREAVARELDRQNSQKPNELSSLNDEARRLREERKYREAIPIAQQALELAERLYGPQDLQVSEALTKLGSLYERQGLYTEAEPLFKRALEIAEQARGQDDATIAWILGELAGLYDSQHRFTEAVLIYKRAL